MADEKTVESTEKISVPNVETTETTTEAQARKVPETIPLLPVRDVVIYPFMILPLFVGREKSVRAVDESLSRDRLILLVAQRDAEKEDPGADEIHSVGTVAMIMRMLKMPDGRVKVLVQGLSRAKIIGVERREPYFEARIAEVPETDLVTSAVEVEAMIRSVKELVSKSVALGKQISSDVVVIISNLDHPGRLADLVASHLDLKMEQAQEVLELFDPTQRLKRVSELLGKELEVLEVQHRIQSQAREEMDKTHREYYLREQLKAIQKELGETDDRSQELQELEQKIQKAKMPAAVESEAKAQLGRLSRMHPDAAEASVIRTYLDWLIELPWSRPTKDKLSIKQASKILNKDHYDLEKVKERILEYLAVRKLKKKMKGPILCFVGPPGVGKTSLGRSIARALGRKFIRISLGGVRDEAEIRGHRRTYIGALPGRVIQGIKQAGSNNPVFMIDEVDKVGTDFRGDPSSALLEVLDPEQNFSFSDHYLGVPFDLSNVMFICTANLADPIISALRDRLEIIDISGYTEEEKLYIAKRYLVPRQHREHGIDEKHLLITDEAILKMINEYTREAGLRSLEREIATICRKVARLVAEGQRGQTRVTAAVVQRFLGAPKFLTDPEQEADEVGVATGLAWTQTGGDIIYIECSILRGKGSLALTGHLGEVMKESAQAALSYARSRSADLGIKDEFFTKYDIHIHVPAGAIPKDGPSAGITMAVALLSALTKVPVRRDVAMTGEVTLRGKVLPVGGIKEKALAARRMGIHTVVVPARNDKDVKELPANVKRGMEFVFVDHMDQVLEIALAKRTRAKRGLAVALSAKRGATPSTELRTGSPGNSNLGFVAQETQSGV